MDSPPFVFCEPDLGKGRMFGRKFDRLLLLSGGRDNSGESKLLGRVGLFVACVSVEQSSMLVWCHMHGGSNLSHSLITWLYPPLLFILNSCNPP